MGVIFMRKKSIIAAAAIAATIGTVFAVKKARR